ncbi:MAG TPA: LLM class flavin-dependent oxidoreductase [Candidatus Limnocylindrales bacterium]|nr:LLM class flavin-dependent oxidoreductase [Candidatus Limnocylindrales bacterium]
MSTNPITFGYGLITVERHPDRADDWPALYREAVDLARATEAAGLDAVWTTEHHFVDTGYLPAPLVLSAAFAVATERIRIGTGVILAPLYHPLWIAEEAAVVDNIADGRLILGMGLGWSETEFAGFGASTGTRGRVLDEVLDILAQAGRDEVIRHEGPLLRVPELAVRPRPAHGRLTTWIGGHADPALRRAGRHADGMLLCSEPEQFRHEVAVLHDSLAAAGRDPAAFEIGQYLTVVPAEGGRDPWDEVGSAVLHADWKYGDMEASATRVRSPLGRPEAAALTADAVEESRRYCLLGSRDEILARVALYREIAAPSPFHLVARNYLPGLSATAQRELLDRFAREIAAG